jgi:hypothetical protein
VRLIRAIALRLFCPSPDLRGSAGNTSMAPDQFWARQTRPPLEARCHSRWERCVFCRVDVTANGSLHWRRCLSAIGRRLKSSSQGFTLGRTCDGHAVYLTSCVDVAPVLLLHNLKHNKKSGHQPHRAAARACRAHPACAPKESHRGHRCRRQFPLRGRALLLHAADSACWRVALRCDSPKRCSRPGIITVAANGILRRSAGPGDCTRWPSRSSKIGV